MGSCPRAAAVSAVRWAQSTRRGPAPGRPILSTASGLGQSIAPWDGRCGAPPRPRADLLWLLGIRYESRAHIHWHALLPTRGGRALSPSVSSHRVPSHHACPPTTRARSPRVPAHHACPLITRALLLLVPTLQTGHCRRPRLAAVAHGRWRLWPGRRRRQLVIAATAPPRAPPEPERAASTAKAEPPSE